MDSSDDAWMTFDEVKSEGGCTEAFCSACGAAACL